MAINICLNFLIVTILLILGRYFNNMLGTWNGMQVEKSSPNRLFFDV